MTIPQRTNLIDMDPRPTAEFYDRMMGRTPFLRTIAKRILELGIEEGKLLHIACGPGHLLATLSRLKSGILFHNALTTSSLVKYKCG